MMYKTVGEFNGIIVSQTTFKLLEIYLQDYLRMLRNESLSDNPEYNRYSNIRADSVSDMLKDFSKVL